MQHHCSRPSPGFWVLRSALDPFQTPFPPFQLSCCTLRVIPEFTPCLTQGRDFGFQMFRNIKSYKQQEGNGDKWDL